MKTWKDLSFLNVWIIALLLVVGNAVAVQAAPAMPAITSVRIEKAEVIVTARVPAGIRKVTLESRARLEAGAWTPSAVARLDGTGGEVTFRLAASAQLEMLRVRADEKELLPSNFYKGTNSFAGMEGGGNSEFTGDTTPTSTSTRDAGGASREVVESDIWKIRGSTLYFFNQYRGLQVIDLMVPDLPVLRGTLDLPAVGEQMYVLESGHVVLLARDGCGWGAAGEQSQVHIVEVVNGIPRIISSLSVTGTIQESRMVGSALYVVSQEYRQMQSGRDAVWEWGSVVSSFDLSIPAKPAAKGTLWYAGYGNVVTATEEFLFVATQDPANWWRSVVHCIDVSSPDGTMKKLSSIKTDGRVPDKFKIHHNGTTLTIISENWNTSGRGVFTLLETFAFFNPASPQKLGQLELARGEQLHATRFDGDRVYIVTFFRVDPLWVVDLANPRAPRIVGELQVPGWSTYIQPLGDKLLTIGIDNSNSWRVAVSLFDVKDPAKPALLDKVPLGENSSWSEANYDEKAFSVLPDDGLILVPYQGYHTNGYASRVQLIDLNATTLKARGTIEHQFQPRRATVHRGRILSIDGNALLVVDAANRDKPIVKAELELAWPVSKVFVQGDYLLEVSNNSYWPWNSQGSATMRVVSANTPDKVINSVPVLNDLPLLGSAVKDGKLYLLQGKPAQIEWLSATTKDAAPVAVTNEGKLVLTLFDLSQLPAVIQISKSEAATKEVFWGDLTPLWVRPGLLVWSGGRSYYFFLDAGLAGTRIASDALFWNPRWGGNGSGSLFAFDVSNAASPRFASELNLNTASRNWWSFSSAFTADGLVYLSHQASEFLEGVEIPGQPRPGSVITIDPKTGQPVTNQPPIGIWVTRYYLDVIDYADAKAPTLRKQVNIPGTLRGLSHNGAVLYTVGTHWDQNWKTDWNEWLDASAYDGVAASLVASLSLKEWPHPLLVKDGNVFLGRGVGENNSSPRLEIWNLADAGKFALINSTALDSSAQDLVAFGNLLAVQQDRSVSLFDVSVPTAPALRGTGQPEGCLWYDLRNADGSLDRGIWLPLNEYGVAVIRVKPFPSLP